MERIKSIYKECMSRHSDKLVVGEEGVKEIEYHTPGGEGDAHYVDIYFDDGTRKRIFRPDHIIWEVE